MDNMLSQDFRHSKILVIGDCIIDHYYHGKAHRLSPEAPVPVVSLDHEDARLGGAANVAMNCHAFGASVYFLGVVGDDRWGHWSKQALTDLGIHHKGLYVSQERRTTVKSRVVTNHQQMVRLDSEDTHTLSASENSALLAVFHDIISDMDVVVISDYAKGVLSDMLVSQVLRAAKQYDVKVLVDPKGKDYSKYNGSYLLSPNKKEAEIVLGRRIDTKADLKQALVDLRERYQLSHAVVTLSEDGVAAYDGEHYQHNTVGSVAVYDVTGAGDTFIASLAYFISQDLAMQSALALANMTAAQSVCHVGNATMNLSDVFACATKLSKNNKLVSIDVLARVTKNISGKVIFTNGCFDILHVGHISYLQQARALGAFLIVAVNSDASVSKLKGPSRPLNSLTDRMQMLAAFDFVDAVVSFDTDTPYDVIAKLVPDVLVKGADYARDEIIGADLVAETKVLPFVQGKSTSNIINKMKVERV